MSFAVHALQDPTSAQITELVQLCVEAYGKEDISLKTLVGGNDLSLLDAFFGASIRAGALGGKLYVATEAADTSVIRGMALWYGPGAESFSTEEEREKLLVFTSRLSPEAQEWHRTVYRLGFRNLTEKLLGRRGKLDSWYLTLLAVDPRHQRLGTARALIDAVRVQANGSELTLAATNELNVGIYRRLGFRVRGGMTMSGSQGDFPVFVLSWQNDTEGSGEGA
ncbi:hypothetical protein DFH07DRAFT_259012 [Mycena maculata]|uniref:N-acetyltransferase domain-containing protein n=1 Tax=Mycena maculata TaxID=230809 RepID=A0AAD7JSE9_9AGAR|nr:hypothetical protein DFH07DRAFT_259012 [Mycena maculata]